MPCHEYSVGMLSLWRRELLKKPPGLSVLSYTETLWPKRVNSWAALNPDIPAPKMTIDFIGPLSCIMSIWAFDQCVLQTAPPAKRPQVLRLSLIHISEPTRQAEISY